LNTVSLAPPYNASYELITQDNQNAGPSRAGVFVWNVTTCQTVMAVRPRVGIAADPRRTRHTTRVRGHPTLGSHCFDQEHLGFGDARVLDEL